MLKFIFLIVIFISTSILDMIAQTSRSEEIFELINELPGNTSIDEYVVMLKRLKLASLEESNNHLLAKSLDGLSYMYYSQKDYRQYESAMEEFMSVAKDTVELGLEHYSLALNNYAVLYKIKGQYRRSIELNLSAIELENRTGGSLDDLGRLYSNISANYRLLGDHENSLNTAYKSLEKYNQLYDKSLKKKDLSISTTYLFIALCLRDLKQPEEAIDVINKGLESISKYRGKRNQEFYNLWIDFYLRRAEVNMQLESFVLILNDLGKVFDFQKKHSYRIYYFYELQGQYYNKKLNFISAMHSFNDALGDAKKVYSDNKEFPAIPRIYKRRANNYVKLDSVKLAFNDYQSGLKYFDKNLENDWSLNPRISISSSAPVGLDLLTAKATLAKNQFQEKSDTTYLTIAKRTYRAAMNLVDDMRLSYINEGSKYYIVEEAQSLYKEHIELLVSAKEYILEDEWSEEVYNTIQRNKNSILIERIKEKVAVLSSGLPIEIKDKESKLRSDVSLNTKLLSEIDESDSTSSVKMKSHQDNLFKAKEDFAIFSNNLKSKYPEYYALSNTTKQYYSLKEVTNRLSPGEAIIEYFETDSGYVSLIISDLGVQVNVLEDEDISRLLIYYIASLSQSPNLSGVSVSELSTQSEQLYSILLGKVNGLEAIEQLYIIPDGLISKLPFSSLINPETKNYLLSEKSISYLVSVDQFMNQEKKTSESKSILGLSPNFSTTDDVVDCQCNGSDLENLSYSMDELTYLQSIYDGSYINEADATKASFIDNVKDFPIIHLATHACLSETDPMLSQIFFSDGSLTNYDLQNLNISPELVVLAACNTAQGEIQKGEGVISLSRGFFEAGVKSLVSSLWSIDDYSSSEIVKGMYTHLKKGKSKAQSLRQSKLDYLKSADKLRSHPYYWAGLVQIGDASAITNTWNWNIIFGSLAMLLVVFFFFFRRRKKMENTQVC